MNKNIDPAKIKQLMGNNKTDTLLSSLNPEEKELLNQLMKDKEARDKFLSSPEVAKFISMLMNGR